LAHVSIRDVSKLYAGDVRAVDGFSLEIEDGDFVVLVGPSGCGKTTMLRMIAGLEEISEGSIEIDGADITDLDPKDRDIAMVFQDYALYPHMTVRDNIAFTLKVRKLPKAEIAENVERVARQLSLEELLDRKPRALSGGQQQRVAIARALVRDPKVFLMDEPLSNLDAKLRVTMRDEIAHLYRTTHPTVVYVTHDQVEAMTLGTRIVVMKDGVIQQADTPRNLYLNPCNAFVAGFIGSPQMNIRKVGIQREGERYRVILSRDPAASFFLDEAYFARTYSGSEVLLGIRPEHARVLSPEELAQGAVGITVDVIRHEIVGAEGYLHVDLFGEPFLVKTYTDRMDTLGGTVPITFNPASCYLFAADTKQTLTVVR
jgi:multiple sugar transport system ATP-binding protein